MISISALLIAAGIVATPAGADSGQRFRFERPVTPGATGPNRLEVDISLLSGATPGLPDLRLFDADGREVPFLLVAPQDSEPTWQSAHLLPILATRDSSGFEADLGALRMVDRLRLSGLRPPFLKRVRLEGSGDREHWTLLVSEATVFDLPDRQLRLNELAFSAGKWRYLRLTWDDHSSARLHTPARVEARLVEFNFAPEPLRAAIEFSHRPSEPGRSRFRLRLPGARLPVTGIVLESGPGHLLREARINESRVAGEAMEPVRLGQQRLRRAELQGLVAADLRIPIHPPQGADLELVVEDGVNPRFDLRAATIELSAQPWIYFESPDGAPLLARYGDLQLQLPRYDLEAMRDTLNQQAGRVPARAAWGIALAQPAPNPPPAEPAMPVAGTVIDTSRFRWRRPLPPAPPGLVAAALDAAVLAHSADLRDVRIVDAGRRQIPYIVERRDEPLSIRLAPLVRDVSSTAVDAPPGTPGGAPAQSLYRIDLPWTRLPGASLVLGTRARVFERTVTLLGQPEREKKQRDTKLARTLSQHTWKSADPDNDAPDLVIELPFSDDSFTLVVAEGDNVPLPLEPPHLLLPSYRLRFYMPSQGSLTLHYGDRQLAAPRYDLSLLAASLFSAPATEIELEPGSEVERLTPAQRFLGNQKRIFSAVLLGAVAVLLLLLGRLLRGATPPGSNRRAA